MQKNSEKSILYLLAISLPLLSQKSISIPIPLLSQKSISLPLPLPEKMYLVTVTSISILVTTKVCEELILAKNNLNFGQNSCNF